MKNNINYEQFNIDQNSRAENKNQKPLCLWLTGLSGSGKSTLANAIENRLNSLRKHTYILDGDNLRHGLNLDLDFTRSDRNENVRRTAEVSKLMVDAGLIVIVGLISPYKKQRSWVRSLFKKDQFYEIYISTSLSECERRDTKGFYQKARSGEIKNFTGISSPYEVPSDPDVSIDTTNISIENCVDSILKKVYLI
ncbi:adenylyl-sulfate kinase [Methylophilaceae bacterium]|nr:adenylyl-sulfate kinase [Methylophilaceae bacterium]